MEPSQLLKPGKFLLSNVQFKKEDALNTMYEQNERLTKLQDAMRLGNLHKHKVKIYFMNAADQLVAIKAKVLTVTEKYVILKNSIMIPIRSIRDVSFI